MKITSGICSIDGASSRTPEASYECVIGSSPDDLKSLFLGVVAILLFILFVIWVYHSSKLYLASKYKFDDVVKLVVGGALFIGFVIAVLKLA